MKQKHRPFDEFAPPPAEPVERGPPMIYCRECVRDVDARDMLAHLHGRPTSWLIALAKQEFPRAPADPHLPTPAPDPICRCTLCGGVYAARWPEAHEFRDCMARIGQPIVLAPEIEAALVDLEDGRGSIEEFMRALRLRAARQVAAETAPQ